MTNLLTKQNISVIKQTFDLQNFHPTDSYNHLDTLSNWIIKDMAAQFELIKYRNKRAFAKTIIRMAEHIIENKL